MVLCLQNVRTSESCRKEKNWIESAQGGDFFSLSKWEKSTLFWLFPIKNVMEIRHFLCKILMKMKIKFANEIPAWPWLHWVPTSCGAVSGTIFPPAQVWELSGAALGCSSSETPHKILLSREGALLIANLFPMNNSTSSCHCLATRLWHTPHSILSLTPPNGEGKGRTRVPNPWPGTFPV